MTMRLKQNGTMSALIVINGDSQREGMSTLTTRNVQVTTYNPQKMTPIEFVDRTDRLLRMHL